jgi:hypothetical protein
LALKFANAILGMITGAQNLWTNIQRFFMRIGSELLTVAANAINGMAAWVNNIKNAILGAPGAIAGALSGLWSTFTHGFDTLASQALTFGTNIVQKIIDGIEGMLSGLATSAGHIADTVKNAVNNVPLIGGIAKMAGFAGGTDDAPGGMALVGELGPELVKLPRHAAVHTAQTTRHMLSAASSVTQQHRRNMLDSVNASVRHTTTKPAPITKTATHHKAPVTHHKKPVVHHTTHHRTPHHKTPTHKATHSTSKTPTILVLEIDGHEFARVTLPYEVPALRNALGIHAH